ncbi:MAG: hypothetical protein ACI3WQ_06190 [Faecousia sp.]
MAHLKQDAAVSNPGSRSAETKHPFHHFTLYITALKISIHFLQIIPSFFAQIRQFSVYLPLGGKRRISGKGNKKTRSPVRLPNICPYGRSPPASVSIMVLFLSFCQLFSQKKEKLLHIRQFTAGVPDAILMKVLEREVFL